MSLPSEDARRKASRMALERLSDGFGARTRIMPMVECLERRGTLTARQARAGARIYRAWVMGVMKVSDGDPPGAGGDTDGYLVAQMEATRIYREVREAVGPRLWPLTFSVVVEDWTPQRWANERGGGERMHKLGAVALLRHALDLAADCLGDE